MGQVMNSLVIGLIFLSQTVNEQALERCAHAVQLTSQWVKENSSLSATKVECKAAACDLVVTIDSIKNEHMGWQFRFDYSGKMVGRVTPHEVWEDPEYGKKIQLELDKNGRPGDAEFRVTEGLIDCFQPRS